MQARALISLAPYLSPGLLQEALKTVLAFEGFTEAVGGLNALAPYLFPGLLQEALKTVLAFEGFTEAVGGLNALAPYLSPGLLQEALKTVRTIEDIERRTAGLIALAPYLPERARHKVLQEALAVKRAIEIDGVSGQFQYTDIDRDDRNLLHAEKSMLGPVLDPQR